MKKEIMIAGFGGQGVMAIGKSLVEAGMGEGREVSWAPSYGPEMRGGTSNCSVILSDEPIGSPLVYAPSELIAMNGPSLKKFEDTVQSGGIIFVNGDSAKSVHRQDVSIPSLVIRLPTGWVIRGSPIWSCWGHMLPQPVPSIRRPWMG